MTGTIYKSKGYTVAPDDMSAKDAQAAKLDILCGTRTGKKVHAASPGSSVTNCGHWMRFASQEYRIRTSQVRTDHILCERCRITTTEGS